jgi:hypothetical protein
MSKYIEFVAKVVRSKSKRQTRKRGGGDITTCDLTPLTEGVTVDDLKSKIRTPQKLKNLKLVTSEKPMSGAFNIARSVKCLKKPDKEIICRVWKNAFYVNSGHIGCVRTYPGCVPDSLERFAEELTISIRNSTCRNTLHTYDIQAITINNPLLSFLSPAEKIKIFGQPQPPHILDDCVCLCVIMKKGDPYEITPENFRKTMDLFDNIAEEDNICMVDIKPGNLLSSGGRVLMIDWDPYFIQDTKTGFKMINTTHRNLFSSCMMKYLFCMFLLIQQILDDDFFDEVTEALDKIIKTTIELTNHRRRSVLFIISSFYNNPNLSNVFARNFVRIFDLYLWSGFKTFDLDLYMDVRPYLIDCPEKARCEELCLQSEGKYTVNYDNSTKSLRYYMNHQCIPGMGHNLTIFFGHRCSTELKNVELTYDEDSQKVNITHDDGIRKRKVDESHAEDDSEDVSKRNK